MSEQINFNSPERISGEEVLDLLDTRGLEDEETRKKLGRYAEQCEAEANERATSFPENPSASNYANVLCQFQLASLYLKSKRYREQGIEAMKEIILSASQDASTKDIEEMARNILQGR